MELDSLRREMDTLTDLSGQLASLSGQQETGRLDQVVSDLSTEWQLTSDRCQQRLQLINSALQQSAVFNQQLAVSIQLTFHCLSLPVTAMVTLFYQILCIVITNPFLLLYTVWHFLFFLLNISFFQYLSYVY